MPGFKSVLNVAIPFASLIDVKLTPLIVAITVCLAIDFPSASVNVTLNSFSLNFVDISPAAIVMVSLSEKVLTTLLAL